MLLSLIKAVFESPHLKYLILLGELVLGLLVIWFVPYTEIDWVAYMDQVKIFVSGERDYV